MKKKKNYGHYCKMCDQYKANEKFSGKGHKTHICKKCALLPVERKNELEYIHQIRQIETKVNIRKAEWNLLEMCAKKVEYPELKAYATEVLVYHRQSYRYWRDDIVCSDFYPQCQCQCQYEYQSPKDLMDRDNIAYCELEHQWSFQDFENILCDYDIAYCELEHQWQFQDFENILYDYDIAYCELEYAAAGHKKNYEL